MPRFLEEKLKREYPNNPHAVYGTMNAIGAMRGNKITAKGRRMEAKHEKDLGAPPATGLREQARREGESVEYEAGEQHSFPRHGRMVREAHEHLSKAMPTYQTLSKRQRGLAIQEHIRARRGM